MATRTEGQLAAVLAAIGSTKKKKTTAATDEHAPTCAYCKKAFAKESTLAAHACEPKRRWQQRNEPAVRIGFNAYLRFYQYTQGAAKTRTYEDFSSSSYYTAFVKFGRYCQDIKAINATRFVEWLLVNNKKLDYWCSDTEYNAYIIEYLKTEHVNDALARAIDYAIQWEEKTGSPSKDCLRYGNENALCYAITTGKLSAWVLYNCASGQELLARLSPEQVNIVWPMIDSDVWQKRFKTHADDRVYAEQILQQAGW